MDCHSTNIFEICKEFGIFAVNSLNEIDNNLKEQTMKLDVFYNDILQSVIKNKSDNVPEKKKLKKQSSAVNGQVGDLFFSSEISFQQPAIPQVKRSKRQASIIASGKINSIRESSTISSGTRASRARALSSDVNITPIDCPKANSTFVVDKRLMDNIAECLSPEMFSSDNGAGINSDNLNVTYNMPIKSILANTTKVCGKQIKLITDESAISTNTKTAFIKCDPKKNIESPLQNKNREKLEDINVNIHEKSQHMTRTMKRKLQEENHIESKKTNLAYLEKQVSTTPLKPPVNVLTTHQVRENEAGKRKELYLKAKANQKKIDDKHLKAAKQREQLKVTKQKDEQFKEKIKKMDELKRVEKQKKEKLKEEKKQREEIKKMHELKIAEVNAKRKLAEEKKLDKALKLKCQQKYEVGQKENEIKKNELKSETSKPVHLKTTNQNLPTSSIQKKMLSSTIKKVEAETNINDYGLNDVSARDSSEDESGPKKPVPDWAKQVNRKAVLELQFHVDSKERDLFFDCPKTLNLKEMFKGWDIRDKKRTSSAVWAAPIRYSEYIRKN